MSQALKEGSKDALVFFYSSYFAGNEGWVTAKNPYALATTELEKLRKDFDNFEDYQSQFTHLKSTLAAQGDSVPTLYKQYTELCEIGGVKFAAFNIDADFADCIDGFMVLDLTTIKSNKRKRYMV